jgi:hypothetical protein
MKEVFRVEIPRKGGRDDLLSRVTALFLTVATLASPSSCSTILFWITSIVADLYIGYGVLFQ